MARRLQRFYDRIVDRVHGDVLDVGCGPGHLAAAIAQAHPQDRVIAFDLDPVQIRLAEHAYDRPNLSFEVAPAHALPLPADSQDHIVATETFHHWSQPEEGLQEVHRVLRPTGTFLLIEGAGDMTKAELAAWTGRRPWPGLITWVRLVFRKHGYTTDALHTEVLPRLQGVFGDVAVTREDGWWVVACRRRQLPKPGR